MPLKSWKPLCLKLDQILATFKACRLQVPEFLSQRVSEVLVAGPPPLGSHGCISGVLSHQPAFTAVSYGHKTVTHDVFAPNQVYFRILAKIPHGKQWVHLTTTVFV